MQNFCAQKLTLIRFDVFQFQFTIFLYLFTIFSNFLLVPEKKPITVGQGKLKFQKNIDSFRMIA